MEAWELGETKLHEWKCAIDGVSCKQNGKLLFSFVPGAVAVDNVLFCRRSFKWPHRFISRHCDHYYGQSHLWHNKTLKQLSDKKTNGCTILPRNVTWKTCEESSRERVKSGPKKFILPTPSLVYLVYLTLWFWQVLILCRCTALIQLLNENDDLIIIGVCHCTKFFYLYLTQ